MAGFFCTDGNRGSSSLASALVRDPVTTASGVVGRGAVTNVGDVRAEASGGGIALAEVVGAELVGSALIISYAFGRGSEGDGKASNNQKGENEGFKKEHSGLGWKKNGISAQPIRSLWQTEQPISPNLDRGPVFILIWSPPRTETGVYFMTLAAYE